MASFVYPTETRQYITDKDLVLRFKLASISSFSMTLSGRSFISNLDCEKENWRSRVYLYLKFYCDS